MNSKNMVQQVFGLQTDFNEALSNTTRGTIEHALSRKRKSPDDVEEPNKSSIESDPRPKDISEIPKADDEFDEDEFLKELICFIILVFPFFCIVLYSPIYFPIY
ncbi:hypothetical protein Glove_74g226 [Diversispora epigaea]|uniref:Uncharacterized protein n=1 Tax=Diversispora epigaea TaxID=1348612 RepID=A0A397JKF5_9GLOM|nr:hypothetical protein Glove_74g226 [Diversispora epigaea]